MSAETTPVSDTYGYGWHDVDPIGENAPRGLSEAVVRAISARKDEPEWMLRKRLKGLHLFDRKPMPTWGADLSTIDFDNIKYYLQSTEQVAASWEDLPDDIKNTYDRLGIPEAEKQRLVAGVAAQYECLSGDSRIYTAGEGLVPISEIKIGTKIYSYDVANSETIITKVKEVKQTKVETTFEVALRNRRIRATKNHPFLVMERTLPPGRTRRGVWAKKWKNLEELSPGDIVAVSRKLPTFGGTKTFTTELEFGPKESNEDILWLLGLLLGDGNAMDKNNYYRFQIAVHHDRYDLRSEIRRVLKEQFLFEDDDIRESHDRVLVKSKSLVLWLHEQGFAGTAYTKAIPRWIFTLPESERLAFLGGYVDADGYVLPKGTAMKLASCQTKLLEDARDLALSCSVLAKTIQKIETKNPHGTGQIYTSYRLIIEGDFEKIKCRNTKRTDRYHQRKYVTSGSSMVRAKDFQDHCNDFIGFQRVVSITELEEEPVWDIQVDGSDNFIAEGIIVHNSTVVYHSIREDLEKQGVIFVDTDTALKDYPELFEEYFATIIPVGDNKFSALNSAVWSGGSFIYVPPNVHVDIPLQAYFRINTEAMGQFERTLIIADEGSSVHYIEGCTAPIYSSDSLHSAVVEIVVKKNAQVRYTTIQNWSTNVYNLVTKRASVEAGGLMEWIDGNLGSKVTMKYPAVYLMGERARGETLSIAMAGPGQHLDAGAKMVHLAPHTSSNIVNKSLSHGGGRTSYRGLLEVHEGAHGSKANVLCDALLLDKESRSDTYPYVDVREDDVALGHEASVSKVSEDQLFYLMQRGMTEAEALAMIVRGFLEPVARTIPMEYALELNRLIEMQMEGSVG